MRSSTDVAKSGHPGAADRRGFGLAACVGLAAALVASAPANAHAPTVPANVALARDVGFLSHLTLEELLDFPIAPPSPGAQSLTPAMVHPELDTPVANDGSAMPVAVAARSFLVYGPSPVVRAQPWRPSALSWGQLASGCAWFFAGVGRCGR